MCIHCEQYSSRNIKSCAMLYLWDIISSMEQSILNNSYNRIGIESNSSGIIQSNFDIMANSIDGSNYQSKSIWDSRYVIRPRAAWFFLPALHSTVNTLAVKNITLSISIDAMYINFILFLVSKFMLIRHYQVVETIRNKDTCYY